MGRVGAILRRAVDRVAVPARLRTPVVIRKVGLGLRLTADEAELLEQRVLAYRWPPSVPLPRVNRTHAAQPPKSRAGLITYSLKRPPAERLALARGGLPARVQLLDGPLGLLVALGRASAGLGAIPGRKNPHH